MHERLLPRITGRQPIAAGAETPGPRLRRITVVSVNERVRDPDGDAVIQQIESVHPGDCLVVMESIVAAAGQTPDVNDVAARGEFRNGGCAHGKSNPLRVPALNRLHYTGCHCGFET